MYRSRLSIMSFQLILCFGLPQCHKTYQSARKTKYQIILFFLFFYKIGPKPIGQGCAKHRNKLEKPIINLEIAHMQIKPFIAFTLQPKKNDNFFTIIQYIVFFNKTNLNILTMIYVISIFIRGKIFIIKGDQPSCNHLGFYNA